LQICRNYDNYCDMLDQFKNRLKAAGASLTPQRLTVFNFLLRHDPTDIHSLIAGCPDMDRASVYRTLALFKQLGIAGDAIISGHKMLELSDSFDTHHHHISCVGCGISIQAHDMALENYLTRLAVKNGIQPASHHVEISGLCGECASREKIASA
jgi:Fur family transcriptional regulator, ferric uptake regulator